MNVLMVEPGKAPYETQIGDDLQSMQALVGGYLEAVYPFEQPVALVCRESGKLDGLTLNRALRDATVIFMTLSRGDFLSSDSANRISPTCRTNLPSGLPSNFVNRKCFCARVTKLLPRRCRTSRCRAVCRTDRRIYETGNNSNHI